MNMVCDFATSPDFSFSVFINPTLLCISVIFLYPINLFPISNFSQFMECIIVIVIVIVIVIRFVHLVCVEASGSRISEDITLIIVVMGFVESFVVNAIPSGQM